MLSVGVGDLGDIYGFEVDFDTHRGFVLFVNDVDELSALAFRELAENGAVFLLGGCRRFFNFGSCRVNGGGG